MKESVFVLTLTPYRDADLIVNFLSRDNGKLSAVIYRGRTLGKSSSFLYNPGDLIEIEYQVYENREFIRIENTIGIDLLRADQISYDQFVIHSYLIEIITKVSKPALPADEIFELLATISQSTWTEKNRYSLLLWAIWKVIKWGGYQIDFSNCCQCLQSSWKIKANHEPAFRKQTYSLLLETGRLVCGSCLQSSEKAQTVSSAMVKILWLFSRSENHEELYNDFPLNTINDLTQLLNNYMLRCYELKPKSLDILTGFLQK